MEIIYRILFHNIILSVEDIDKKVGFIKSYYYLKYSDINRINTTIVGSVFKTNIEPADFEGLAIFPFNKSNKNENFIWKRHNKNYTISDFKILETIDDCLNIVIYNRTTKEPIRYKKTKYNKVYCIGLLYKNTVYEVFKLLNKNERDGLIKKEKVYYREDSESIKFIEVEIYKFVKFFNKCFIFYENKEECIDDIYCFVNKEIKKLKEEIKIKEEKLEKLSKEWKDVIN